MIAAKETTAAAAKPKNETKKSEKKGKKKPSADAPEIDMNDLAGFNTERKALIKEDDFSKLFVAEDSNKVMEQFEAEKDAAVEAELGTKVAVPDVKRGWNEWAGAGANDSRYADRVAKAEKFKRDKIAELRQKRAD